VVLGGGLGIRLGESHLGRIEKAMAPHLFSSHRPPALHVAALGDLGGAVGAALLVSRGGARRSGSRERRGGRPTRRSASRSR
jgi:hypothetical protein